MTRIHSTIYRGTILSRKTESRDSGVAMFISNISKWQRRYDFERNDLERIWIETFPYNAKIFLLSIIYWPPDGSKYLFKSFSTLLNDTLNLISSEPKECIIMGDTNINYLDKNNHNDIKDIFMLNGYKQLVTKATRITEDSKTLIDTIFTNKPENISKTDTIPTSLSDHDMVGCVRKLNHLKYESKTLHCRNYKNYDPKALQKDLQEQSWVIYYSFKEPNSAWIYLKSI